MNAMLLEWGFTQSGADPCLYVHTKRGIRLLVYVDDIVATTKTTDQLDWFFKKLSGCFTAKNLREISKILDVRVTRNRTNRTIDLDQEQYLDKVLNKFSFPNAKHKPVLILIDGYNNLRLAIKDDRRVD